MKKPKALNEAEAAVELAAVELQNAREEHRLKERAFLLAVEVRDKLKASK